MGAVGVFLSLNDVVIAGYLSNKFRAQREKRVIIFPALIRHICPGSYDTFISWEEHCFLFTVCHYYAISGV